MKREVIIQRFSMVLNFKNIKYKMLNKIIVLSQKGILGPTSDKTSVVTLHLTI